MNNQKNIMSSVIRIVAGIYVIYLAKSLIEGYLSGEVTNIIFPIAAVLFVLSGIFFTIDGVRNIIRYSKEYTKASENTAGEETPEDADTSDNNTDQE